MPWKAWTARVFAAWDQYCVCICVCIRVRLPQLGRFPCQQPSFDPGVVFSLGTVANGRQEYLFRSLSWFLFPLLGKGYIRSAPTVLRSYALRTSPLTARRISPPVSRRVVQGSVVYLEPFGGCAATCRCSTHCSVTKPDGRPPSEWAGPSVAANGAEKMQVVSAAPPIPSW